MTTETTGYQPTERDLWIVENQRRLEREMAEQAATTEQEQGQWVFVWRTDADETHLGWDHIGGEWPKILRTDGRSAPYITRDLHDLLRDPSRVLLVSAYPDVVEAVEAEIRRHHEGTVSMHGLIVRLETALSGVHPADSDKT